MKKLILKASLAIALTSIACGGLFGTFEMTAVKWADNLPPCIQRTKPRYSKEIGNHPVCPKSSCSLDTAKEQVQL